MPGYILIAELIGTYRKTSYLITKLHTDFPGMFNHRKVVYIDFFGEKKRFTIEDYRQFSNGIGLKFVNFDSPEQCEVLFGKLVYVDENQAVSLPEDTFFIHDLVGSSVFRNNKRLGIITDVMQLPANDVYVIEDGEGHEILIPALKQLIVSFNAEEKILILQPGEDLYEN